MTKGSSKESICGSRTLKDIFVNPDFFPDSSAASQLASHLAFLVAARDHRVGVITGRQGCDPPDGLRVARKTAKGMKVHRLLIRLRGKRRSATDQGTS